VTLEGTYRRLRRLVPVRQTARLAGLVGLALLSVLVAVLVVRSWISDVSVEFLLTSLVVVLVPGTGVVYTISSSIGGGWRRGLFAAIGCTLGIVPHVLAAMLGLSGIMQAGAVAFETVRWVGVAYLVFMGLSMIRDGGALRLDEDRTASTDPPGVVVRRGILLNLLNPKLTVFFFAFLPQFLDSPPGLLDARLIGLAGIFMLMTLAVFAVYAWASATVRERVLAAPVVLRWVRRSMGALLIGFAARLAVTDR
jgi:threonine/homoserine/homoserine lactone efflux protein